MNEKDILEIAIKAFIKETIVQVQPIFSDVKSEIKQFFNKGISSYLNKQKDRYSKIKTILHGTDPVDIYDFYYPLKLRNNGLHATDSISSLFKTVNFITVIGDAGSGKSTLIKHLFLNSINEKYLIPIVIELRHLQYAKNCLEEYLKKIILENGIAVSENILDRLLKLGKFVIFLDGFDEINTINREEIIENINCFINKYIENKYLLTSRPFSHIEALPLFRNYHMEKLSDSDIVKFIKQQVKDEELSTKILDSTKEGKNSYIKSFLTNPLLLSLYILTYQNHPSIPPKKYGYIRLSQSLTL